MPSATTVAIWAAQPAAKQNKRMKIICIGECSLNIVLDHTGRPMGAMPGGRIVNAAAILAGLKNNVVMASEAAADPVGDIVANFLTTAGVDLASLDRFTEGRTPLNIFICKPGDTLVSSASITRYDEYPEEGFDIIWPRVDEGDVVLYGGHYAIDARMRPRLSKFLENAAERKCVMVYLPGFLPQQEPRITRVMPAILENLELANLVVARNKDLELIFGLKHPEQCYHDHIDFYCRSMINVDTECSHITYYAGKEMTQVDIPASTSATMIWNAGAVAGIVAAIAEMNMMPDAFTETTDEVRRRILTAATLSANEAAKTLSQTWQNLQ